MSKSVLVVNTPKCCFDCDFWTDDKHCFRCIVANKKYDDNSIVQEWCPLKSLPSFKAVDLNDTRDVVMFCHGWNTCLAEITGETE